MIKRLDYRHTLPIAFERSTNVFKEFECCIDPRPLSRQLAPYGRLGTLLARGTVNAATLIALLESGVFDELPQLQVVVTTLAIGGGAFSWRLR